MSSSGVRRRAFVAFCAVLSVPCAARIANENALRSFDSAVAGNLPRTVLLPRREGRGRVTLDSELTVTRSIDVDIRFPDDTEARTYLATFDGETAIVTRSAGHLDIAVPRADGIALTGFHDDSTTLHRADAPSDVSHRTEAAHASRRQSPQNGRAQPDLSFLDPTETRPSLTLWVFLHDDTAGVSRQHVHAGYLSWWITDLRRLLPHHRLRIYYRERRAGVTDIAYGEKATSMRRWISAATDFRTRAALTYRPNEDEHKFMLVTRNPVAPSTMGLALPEGDYAMGSLTGPWSVVAHEFGHTLGAVHADAAMWWSYVWPCGTNLYPTNHKVLANCYRYTEANERRIVNYFGSAPSGRQGNDAASIVE